MATIGDLWINVKANTKKLAKGLGSARGMLGKFGKFAASPAGLAVAGFAALTAGVYAATKAISSSVKEFMAFEAAMAEVKSIMLDLDGKEFDPLIKQAKLLGSTTSFTAAEAAAGMANLARAGFKAGEIMASIPAVLDLAAANSMELAEAANITAIAVRGFGLSAEEAAHAADILAVGASKTNTDVAGLGEGLSYIAPVAKQLGFSMEETVALMGKLADAGIKGSKGGTALRTMFLKLGPEIEKNGTKAFYDYLKAGHGVQENFEMFGKLGVTAAGVLGDVTDETRELKEAMESADGVVAQMAKRRLDTLAGDVTLFESAVSGLQVAIGERLSPTLREAVQAATDFVNIFTNSMSKTRVATEEASEGMNAFQKVLTGVASAMITVDTWVSKLYNTVAFVVNGIKTIVLGAVLLLLKIIEGAMSAVAGLMGFFGMDVDTSALDQVSLAVEELAARTYQAGLDVTDNLEKSIVSGVIGVSVEVVKRTSEFAGKMKDSGKIIGQNLAEGIAEGIAKGPILMKDGGKIIGHNLADGIAEGISTGLEEAADDKERLTDVQEVLLKSMGKMKTKLEEQVKFFGMSNAEMLKSKMETAKLDTTTQDYVITLEKKVDAMKEAQDEYNKLDVASQRLLKSMRTPQEVFDDEVDSYKKMVKAKLITTIEMEEAIAKLRKGAEGDIEVNILTKGIVEGLDTALGTVNIAGQVNKGEQIAKSTLSVQENMNRLTESITASTSATSKALTGTITTDVSGLKDKITSGIGSATLKTELKAGSRLEELAQEEINTTKQYLTESNTLLTQISEKMGEGGALT